VPSAPARAARATAMVGLYADHLVLGLCGRPEVVEAPVAADPAGLAELAELVERVDATSGECSWLVREELEGTANEGSDQFIYGAARRRHRGSPQLLKPAPASGCSRPSAPSRGAAGRRDQLLRVFAIAGRLLGPIWPNWQLLRPGLRVRQGGAHPSQVLASAGRLLRAPPGFKAPCRVGRGTN